MRVAPFFLAVFAASPAAAQASGEGALHEALGAPENFQISGSFRARAEAVDGQFRPDVAQQDQLVSLRTTLFAEYDGGPFRLGAEFHDARGYLQAADSSADTGVVNALEFSQYYLGADLGDALGGGSETRVTLGRMTMALGSSRLISRQNFRNSMNSYTGARLERTAPGGRRFVVFWTMPNVRLPSDRASILNNEARWDRETTDVQLYGVFNAQPLGERLLLETYAYGFSERDAPGYETANRKIVTPGFRLKRAQKGQGFDFELEAMAQFGSARASRSAGDTTRRKVRAYGIHGDFGYSWAGGWAPRASAFFDYYTGDRHGAALNRFDFLYGGRRFEFGPTALYGPVSRSNLISPGIRIEAKPTKRLSVMSNLRWLWLDSATDSFGLTGVRDPAGTSGRNAGQQLEAQLRYEIIPKSVQLELGYARLFKGNFLRNAPNAPLTGDTNYGYADVTFLF